MDNPPRNLWSGLETENLMFYWFLKPYTAIFVRSGRAYDDPRCGAKESAQFKDPPADRQDIDPRNPSESPRIQRERSFPSRPSSIPAEKPLPPQVAAP